MKRERSLCVQPTTQRSFSPRGNNKRKSRMAAREAWRHIVGQAIRGAGRPVVIVWSWRDEPPPDIRPYSVSDKDLRSVNVVFSRETPSVQEDYKCG